MCDLRGRSRRIDELCREGVDATDSMVYGGFEVFRGPGRRHDGVL